MNLIVYGSLINTNELREIGNLEKDIEELVPIRIRFFKRLFNKKSSRRSGEGNKIGVLNVEYTGSESDFFNGILLTHISQEAKKAFNEREIGYTLTKVKRSFMNPYNKAWRITEDAYVYTALDHMKSSNIEPIPEYAELCLKGAKEWGEIFFRDFIESTYDAQGRLFYKTEN